MPVFSRRARLGRLMAQTYAQYDENGERRQFSHAERTCYERVRCFLPFRCHCYFPTRTTGWSSTLLLPGPQIFEKDRKTNNQEIKEKIFSGVLRKVFFCSQAQESYETALRKLGKCSKNSALWDSMSFDLSSTYFIVAQLMQENPPLSEMDVEQVRMLFMTALHLIILGDKRILRTSIPGGNQCVGLKDLMVGLRNLNNFQWTRRISLTDSQILSTVLCR